MKIAVYVLSSVCIILFIIVLIVVVLLKKSSKQHKETQTETVREPVQAASVNTEGKDSTDNEIPYTNNKDRFPMMYTAVLNNFKDDDQEHEKAVITYFILQSKANNIMLGKKNNIGYIAFKNPKLNDFLVEWTNYLRLNQKNLMSNTMYNFFLQNQLLENKIKQENAEDNIINDI